MRHILATHVLLICLLLTGGYAEQASAQDLHTYVDRDSVRAGDTLTLSLVLNRDQDYVSVRFPGVEAFEDGELHFLEREHHRVGGARDSVVYHLQFFGTDDLEIPGFQVELEDEAGEVSTLASNPVPLTFKSVLEEGEDQFRPMKPIFTFAASLLPWLLLTLLLLAVGFLIYRFYTRQPATELPAEPTPAPLPFNNPLHQLKEELEALSGDHSPLGTRNFEAFYIRLGDAMRRYIENVYKIRALEMTSGELLRSLREYPADHEVIESARRVLNEADMVKFARFEPDMQQAGKALEITWTFFEVVSRNDETMIEQLQAAHESKQHAGHSLRSSEEQQ